MRTLLIVVIIGSITLKTIQAHITATQMGMLDFQVDQSLTVEDMNGTNDVTTKLQAAVDKARLAHQTLFIPSGKYKVSNTIDCVLEYSGWSALTPVSIVGSSINRPLIVLADNAEGFSGTIPKCVFKYRATVHTTPDCIMEGGIRALNFDLGSGNTKAVAVNWGCAQYCFIEDISVEARDGFAGFLALGGANQLFANNTVNGGQYGLYLPNYTEAQEEWGLSGEICQSTITGCTFTNQSISALSLWGYGGITMSGITIVQASGTAIKLRGEDYSKVIQFPFSLIDSKIEFTTSDATNLAIDNSTKCNVSLRGVYVKGSEIISKNFGDENLTAITPITDWTRVSRYDYIEKANKADSRGNSYVSAHYDAVTGTYFKTAITDKDATNPPDDLTSKHIWAATPSFEDADAVLVVAGSTAAQIQAAIDANQKVCLAKGTYTLEAPITLKANTIFFGCPGIGDCGSILENGFSPTEPSWLIETENDAAATTYLMDIATSTTNIDYMGSVNWKAGANSIIRTIWLDKGWQDYERNIVRLYFSNNGGGRVFNYQDEKGNGQTTDYYNSGHRKVKISGTSQPLTFYGLNLERGGALYPVSTWPMLEIVNASNIKIFGAKTETFQPYATIENSSDVFITNLIDYCANGAGTTGVHYLQVTGASDRLEFTNIVFTTPPDSTWKLVTDLWNTNTPNRFTNLGIYYRNWSSIAEVTSSITSSITNPLNGTDSHKLLVYPNPANEFLTIELNDASLNEKAQIYNTKGELVKDINVTSGRAQYSIEDLQRGVYFIHLKQSLYCTVKFKKQ